LVTFYSDQTSVYSAAIRCISNHGAVDRPLFPKCSLIMHARVGQSLVAMSQHAVAPSSHAHPQRAFTSTNHLRAFEIGHHNIFNMARRRGSWFCLRKKCH